MSVVYLLLLTIFVLYHDYFTQMMCVKNIQLGLVSLGVIGAFEAVNTSDPVKYVPDESLATDVFTTSVAPDTFFTTEIWVLP
jgi:hypothetical protein